MSARRKPGPYQVEQVEGHAGIVARAVAAAVDSGQVTKYRQALEAVEHLRLSLILAERSTEPKPEDDGKHTPAGDLTEGEIVLFYDPTSSQMEPYQVTAIRRARPGRVGLDLHRVSGGRSTVWAGPVEAPIAR